MPQFFQLNADFSTVFDQILAVIIWSVILTSIIFFLISLFSILSLKKKAPIFIIVATVVGASTGLMYGVIVGSLLSAALQYFAETTKGYILLIWGSGVCLFTTFSSIIVY